MKRIQTMVLCIAVLFAIVLFSDAKLLDANSRKHRVKRHFGFHPFGDVGLQPVPFGKPLDPGSGPFNYPSPAYPQPAPIAQFDVKPWLYPHPFFFGTGIGPFNDIPFNQPFMPFDRRPRPYFGQFPYHRIGSFGYPDNWRPDHFMPFDVGLPYSAGRMEPIPNGFGFGPMFQQHRWRPIGPGPLFGFGPEQWSQMNQIASTLPNPGFGPRFGPFYPFGSRYGPPGSRPGLFSQRFEPINPNYGPFGPWGFRGPFGPWGFRGPFGPWGFRGPFGPWGFRGPFGPWGFRGPWPQLPLSPLPWGFGGSFR